MHFIYSMLRLKGSLWASEKVLLNDYIIQSPFSTEWDQV